MFYNLFIECINLTCFVGNKYIVMCQWWKYDYLLFVFDCACVCVFFFKDKVFACMHFVVAPHDLLGANYNLNGTKELCMSWPWNYQLLKNECITDLYRSPTAHRRLSPLHPPPPPYHSVWFVVCCRVFDNKNGFCFQESDGDKSDADLVVDVVKDGVSTYTLHFVILCGFCGKGFSSLRLWFFQICALCMLSTFIIFCSPEIEERVNRLV